MVATRCPQFASATARCIAIVDFPVPPFSLPTTMTCSTACRFAPACTNMTQPATAVHSQKTAQGYSTDTIIRVPAVPLYAYVKRGYDAPVGLSNRRRSPSRHSGHLQSHGDH